MKKVRTILILVALAMIPSLTHLGCDGGGDDNSGNRTGQTTVINGTVTDVIAMRESEQKTIKFAELIKLLSFIKEAKAQGGITVTAIVDGIVVDTDITDPDGSFMLSFLLDSGDNITLIFDIDGTTVSISIFAQEGSVINIDVAINLNAPDGDEVEIVEMTESEGTIRCETGTVNLTTNPGQDLIIDGGGEEDCIRTEGNCSVLVDSRNIILTSCERCIDSKGTSQVILTANNGDILCDAFEDGIRAEGDASVVLDTNGDISVSAVENGAKADGNSAISFTASTCIFDSGEDTFDEDGNAMIDSAGCGEIIEGAIPSPSPSASPSLSPEPSPEASPEP